jgi:hypothetical protein
MNDECAVCHLWFEREEGYFLGAMIVDYAIAMVATTIFGIGRLRSCAWWLSYCFFLWFLRLRGWDESFGSISINSSTHGANVRFE